MSINNQDNHVCDEAQDAEREALIGLIKLAKEGSNEALSKLVSKYTPLIESQVSKHRQSDMNDQDVEDMRQEALGIFCNALCCYDYEIREVEFGLYAKICIQNGLISHLRKHNRERNRLTVSLDHAEQLAKNSDDPLSKIVEREREEEIVGVIREVLSSYENRIWWLYFQGMSASKIAETLGDGTTAKSVSNAIYRIRRKLKECFPDCQY